MDKYILGQSNMEKVSESQLEVRIDLELVKNNLCEKVLIYGHIKDYYRNAILNAKISFLNVKGEEIGLAYSYENGLYTYYGVNKCSKIRIVVNKKGYKRYVSNLMKICEEKIMINICMQKSIHSMLSIISGHIYNEVGTPLENIIVYLIDNNRANRYKKIYKTTVSNKYGQYVFYDIRRGEYDIFVSNSDFLAVSRRINIVEFDKIYDIDIRLNRRCRETKIMGYIKDENDEFVSDAIVVLYRVSEFEKLIPVEYTNTDEYGKYYFENVNYDRYIVKAIK